MLSGRHIFRTIAVAAALAVATLTAPRPASAAGAAGAAGAGQHHCPWVHSGAPIPVRVGEVISQMTLDDKIAMVDGTGFSFGTAGYVGHIAANPGLCIPGLNLEDGPQGVADGVPGVTQLPAPVALAAAWDPELAREYGSVVGSEERGKGADVNLGPTVNIVRDPRWGRAFETYGEDPYLAGQTAAGFITGVQSQGVLSQVKHWAVYNQETNRNTPADDALVSQRTMQEIYMPQFKAAVTQARAASVMCSYATVNGHYACENDYLLSVLKQQWKFPGFVTSDWGATHSTVPSALAGLDMQMPGGQGFGTDYYGQPLKHAVLAGRVPMTVLNGMVSRILTEMFRFDLFDHPPTGSLTAVVTTPAHAQAGREAAEAGTVLLKNAGGVLPVQPGRDKSIAVIGSDGGRYAMTSGGGSAAVIAPYIVTPEQGITARGAASGVRVSYAQGDVPVSGALQTVPAEAFPRGLTATYYNNTTFSGAPAATGTVPDVALAWGGKPPASGVNPSGWSAKFTGTVSLPAAGQYALSLSLSGTASVSINGKPAFTTQTSFNGVARATLQLPAGRVRIEVDYADTIPFPSDGVTLGWAPPQTPSLLSQAVAAAKKADLAVVFASNFETEGADLTTIDLPASENRLISAVAAANPNTVVVLNTGSAVTMPWLNQVKGVIEAWYPGQDDGDEIAAVLFGDVNPSGKLPVTFPRSLAQVPASTAAQWPGVNGKVHYSEGVLVGYRWYTTRKITPLFPFGAGLSYTSFAFSGIRVRPARDGHLVVSADITNTGRRAGADVAQLYVGDPAQTGEPAEQLKGFQRVTLRPGQTRRVSFTLDRSAFAWWNERSGGWTVSPGTYALMVGDSSANLPLIAHVTVPGDQSPVVRTESGLLRGKAAEGTDQFLGIPYAAPPVGALRWTAPQPPPRWRGIRQATAYGSRCSQLASGNGPRVDNEDCLYLNVYIPPGAGHAARLPVLFMIHGGGLTSGAGDQHDGSLIVNTDHIIVVSINYRLGPFGFLTVPGLGNSALTSSGNFGLLDQEAALRWVRRNIGAFGGDPDRVTIDGESAGGWSVCALLTSPRARGLFHGAIMQSGSCVTRTRADAQTASLAFAKQAGCPDAATAAACLRALPERALLDASASYQPLFVSGGPELPVPPAQAVASGDYTRVPLLIGVNHNEGRTFAQGFTGLTRQQAAQVITQLYGARAPQILARYPWTSYLSPYTAAYQIGDIWTDSGYVGGIGGCPSQNLAAQFAATTPTFFYQFDDLHAPGLNNDHPGYQWGAGHAMELAYLWPSFNNGYSLYDLLTPAQLELSRQMVRYWGAFTALGAPDSPGQPSWPRYTSGQLMSLRPGGQTTTITAGTYAAEHQCGFWNASPR
jgi:beta-glucosidase